MKKYFLIIILSALAIQSCKEEKEDITTSVNKEGAIESVVSVQHLDSTRDILVTKHTVWNNYVMAKEVVHYDTIPSLGKETVESMNGNTSGVSAPQPKDYEIYITVQ